jgi:hypothetical protein
VDIEEASFPGAPALHSFAVAQSNRKGLFIGGRTNGIHSFDPLPINNFSPSQANHWVWVVDPVLGQAWSVDLYDSSITPPLGLVADSLSSNNTQSFQNGDTLYIIGGYGYNRTTNPHGHQRAGHDRGGDERHSGEYRQPYSPGPAG